MSFVPTASWILRWGIIRDWGISPPCSSPISKVGLSSPPIVRRSTNGRKREKEREVQCMVVVVVVVVVIVVVAS